MPPKKQPPMLIFQHWRQFFCLFLAHTKYSMYFCQAINKLTSYEKDFWNVIGVAVLNICDGTNKQ